MSTRQFEGSCFLGFGCDTSSHVFSVEQQLLTYVGGMPNVTTGKDSAEFVDVRNNSVVIVKGRSPDDFVTPMVPANAKDREAYESRADDALSDAEFLMLSNTVAVSSDTTRSTWLAPSIDSRMNCWCCRGEIQLLVRSPADLLAADRQSWMKSLSFFLPGSEKADDSYRKQRALRLQRRWFKRGDQFICFASDLAIAIRVLDIYRDEDRLEVDAFFACMDGEQSHYTEKDNFAVHVFRSSSNHEGIAMPLGKLVLMRSNG